jgi:hypothetical protein
MNNFIRVIIIIALVLTTISCDNDSNTHAFNVDCIHLEAGIINYDRDLVNIEITKLLTDLYPAVTNSDPLGHSNNIEILINRMNLCNGISARLFCYACIKTYPLQSEILVETDSSGFALKRILDIKTPEDSKLEFVNIHQAYSSDSLILQGVDYQSWKVTKFII